jgi:hypothetical protein
MTQINTEPFHQPYFKITLFLTFNILIIFLHFSSLRQIVAYPK